VSFSVFVSASWKDRDTVDKLVRILQQYEIQPILSWDMIRVGDPIVNRIRQQIRASDCVLAIIGKHGGRSESMDFEVGMAIGLNKIVVPLIEEGADIPKALIEKQYILIDKNRPELSYERAAAYLNSLKIEKERRNAIGGLVLLGIGLLFLAALGSED